MPAVGKLDIGTRFLSSLRGILPFPLLENVGILNAALMNEFSSSELRLLREYARRLAEPLAAVNLCGSLEGEPIGSAVADEAMYEGVIARCLSDQGEPSTASDPCTRRITHETVHSLG